MKSGQNLVRQNKKRKKWFLKIYQRKIINFRLIMKFTTTLLSTKKTDVLLYPKVPTPVGYLSLFRNKKIVLFCDT